MADYTATTSMTLEQAITNGGMVDGDVLTINNGAVVTCNQTPSILIERLAIVDGEFFIDGENIVAGNKIMFICEYKKFTQIYNYGKFKTRGGWVSLGTTDGTASQNVDISAYWGGSFEDTVPAIWVETGRRIDFDNALGITPVVDQWVYKVGDNDVFGRIVEVGPTYLVVKYLTGSLADNDAIECIGVVDNKGPDNDVFWTANVNNPLGDIKQAGVYQSFANARSNSTSQIERLNKGVGGFAFEHTYQSNTITMASVLGGFIPPVGCDIRVPNIHCSTSSLTEYALGKTYHDGTSVEQNWHRLSGSNGSLDFSLTNFGLYTPSIASPNSYVASQVGTFLEIGGRACSNAVNITDCVITDDSISKAVGSGYAVYYQQCLDGGTCDEVHVLNTGTNAAYLGGTISNDLIFKNCIAVSIDAVSSPINLLTVSNAKYDNCICISESSSYGLSISSSNKIEMKNTIVSFKHQPLTPASGWGFYFSSSSDIYISGVKILGSEWGLPFYSMFYPASSHDIKIRALGMVDKKVDFGSDVQWIIRFTGLCFNIDVARVFRENGSNDELTNGLLASKNITFTNCSGSYDSRVYPYIPSGKIMGVHGASEPLGAGLEVDLSAVSNINWGDVFRSDTTGALFLLFCEGPTGGDYTVISGNPTFSRDGDMNLKVGDQIVFEMDYFALGHTGLTGLTTYAASSGTTADGVDEWGSGVTVEFQYDNDGGGYNGTWLDQRIPANLSSIVVDPSIGIKIKTRLTCTSDTSLINGMFIHTTTSIAAQKANLHPIDQVQVQATATVLSGTRIQLYNVTTDTEIDNVVSGSVNYVKQLTATNGDIIRFRATKLGYEPIEAFAQFSGVSIGFVGDQVLDEVYQINGIDGSTMTQYSYDSGNVQIDINDADGETTLQEFWAWYNYFMTTEIGINLVGGFTALDEVNYRINTDLFTFQFENVNPLPVRISGGYIYRSDGDLMLADTGNSILMEPAKAYIVNSAQLARKTDIYPLY